MSPLSSLSPLSPPSPFAKTDGGSLKLSKKSSNLFGKVKNHLRAARNFVLFLVVAWVKCLPIDAFRSLLGDAIGDDENSYGLPTQTVGILRKSPTFLDAD